ncbi:hypothetical protein L915_07441 [Phytophthora nicotianae]|uniref:DDE Tnp4 domain-containing protein n=2 Tax=Phytophthora nicotianae TaxID=4792 RepID=W2H140_PHYNI|nr:hypothetical protein L915_07441 [Phytophthora nicotianae]
MKREGFADCVGFVDRTTFTLPQKPGVEGAFLRFTVGGPVPVLTARFIVGCAVKNGYKPYFLSSGQYLLKDSAYPADKAHTTLVPAYKKIKQELTTQFSTHVCLT